MGSLLSLKPGPRWPWAICAVTLLASPARAQPGEEPQPEDDVEAYGDLPPAARSPEDEPAAAEARPAEGDTPTEAPTDAWTLPGGPQAGGARAQPDEAHGYTEEPGVEPEDIGLFVPRAILFLPRLALRLVYYPIQKGLRFVEASYIIEEVEDILYNDERTAAIIPILSVNSDFGPQLGVRAFHEDLGGNEEYGALGASIGGRYQQAYEMHFEADRAGGSRLWLESHTTFEVQPRMRFFGFGDPDSPITEGVGLDPRLASVETRFRHQRFRQSLTAGLTIGEPGALTKIGMTSRLKRHDFGPGEDVDDDERLETVFDTAQVPGFDLGATLAELEANLVVDTRDKEGKTSSGTYLGVFAGGALPFRQYEYFRYGAELTGYIDLFKETRVLVLRGAFHAVEGEEDEIPFVELPSLGGANRLRGYSLHRFRDLKSAVATVEYHYPIHELLAGALYLDVGEVARTYRELVSDPNLRVGGGGGFIIRGDDSILITLDVAYGEGLEVYATTDPLRAFADLDDDL